VAVGTGGGRARGRLLTGPAGPAAEGYQPPLTPGRLRPAWAEVDLDAIKHNAARLLEVVAPAGLCAVVKADAYGHGAPEVAEAALAAGASWLAVALIEEGVRLRQAGLEAPILVLCEPVPEAMGPCAAWGLSPTVCTEEGIAAAEAAAADERTTLPVHLKVDTGMHRLGAPPEQALLLAQAAAAAPHLRFEGLWTHLAVAEELDDGFTGEQLARFESVRASLRASGLVPDLVHAANSAAAIAHPAARYDVVRCGIALYGYPPGPAVGRALDDLGVALRPALSLKARVSACRLLPAGERVSYGRVRPLPQASLVATVPLGYADGVPRRLSTGAEVLVGGTRRPLAGTVTMDQLMVDCGPGSGVEVGDEVVLLGSQGEERIGADEWAAALGTITYEVLCDIGPRVPRVARHGTLEERG
jgi:alanine racemase